MIDLRFVHTIEAALARAVCAAQANSLLEPEGGALSAPTLRKLCKDAALQLFFDLDGVSLLDLGMNKLSAEQAGLEAVAQPSKVRSLFETRPLRAVFAGRG